MPHSLSPAASWSALRGRRAAAQDTRRSPWRSLRHRGMRWWSAANLLSNVGTWMQLTAQNLLVLQLTHSAAATGLSLAVQAAPALLLGSLGGAKVDGWPRRLTVAGSQSLLATVAFTTAVLVGLHLLTVPVLLALAAVTGLIATVDGPACALLGNDLVPRADVPSAIAVGSVVHGVGRVAGTALAGITIGLFGLGGAYAANGVSFLCVVAVIPLLPAALNDEADEPVAARMPGTSEAPARPVTSAASGTSKRAGKSSRGVREGLGYFFTRRNLVLLALLSAVSSTLGRNYGLTFAALITGPMHGSMKQYAMITTVLAVGGTAGAVLAGRLRMPSVRLVAGLTLAGALLQAAGALSPGVAVLVVLVVPMAIVESLCDTATTTILQTDPPPSMRGRVLGAWRSLSTGWQLGGPPLLGLLIQLAGARGALFAGGLVTAGTIGGAAVLRSGSRDAVRARLRSTRARLSAVGNRVGMPAVATLRRPVAGEAAAGAAVGATVGAAVEAVRHRPGCAGEACLAGCAG